MPWSERRAVLLPLPSAPRSNAAPGETLGPAGETLAGTTATRWQVKVEGGNGVTAFRYLPARLPSYAFNLHLSTAVLRSRHRKPSANRVPHQFRRACAVETLHQPRPIGLDGLDVQVELSGDFLVAQTLHDQDQHLAFAEG